MAKSKQQTVTKEQVFEASMGREFRENFEEPQKSFTANNVVFNLVKSGRTDFDYDSDSGTDTAHVYQAGEFFIALEGTYWSYSGLKFNRWYFAQPQEVTKIEYVRV